jgi:DnaJ-class molecular chaperone
MAENYYDILGVGENATKEEIKKAYRSMQMKYHPDKNHGSQDAIDMTQKINGAYEILGDEQKRAEYDMMRNNPFARMHHQNQGPGQGQSHEVPFNDILNMFFGGGGPGGPNPFFMTGGMPPGVHMFHNGMPMPMPMQFQRSMNKPVPILKTLQINMEQVLNGASVPVEIERWMLEDGNKIFEKETIYVDVPPGVDDNEMVILRDKGNIMSDQCRGDIKITIAVQNNTAFKRAGLDLILEKTITLKEALCGFSFDIKYVNGKSYTLNNNRGSIVPPHYRKVYQDMGLKRGDHKGNMVILFNVEFPDKLTEEQIDKLLTVL